MSITLLDNLLIGLTKTELTALGSGTTKIEFNESELCNINYLLNGDLNKRSLNKIRDELSIEISYVSEPDLMLMRNTFLKVGNSEIYLDMMTDWQWSELRTSETTSLVTINRTSKRFITITGVWLATDTTKAGTNYYTGGSFSEEDYEIILGTAVPSAETDVIIDYTYNGFLGVIKNISFTPMFVKNSKFYEISFDFIGK